MTSAFQYLILCVGVGIYNFKASWFMERVVRSSPVTGLNPHTDVGYTKPLTVRALLWEDSTHSQTQMTKVKYSINLTPILI